MTSPKPRVQIAKKRRTLGVLPGHDEDEDENAFWTGRVGPSHGKQPEKKVARADKTEESSPSPAILRYLQKPLYRRHHREDSR